ncbi:hypothetical protein GOV04_04075 [Candidatus Woesearchaeota archaeon]|nr:hypothetical protein [Candidatus Woesearchaeota archaeon]
MADKKKLRQDLQEAQRKVQALRKDLNKLGRVKEETFKKKEEQSNKIKELFDSIKRLKKERNKLTDTVKVLKEKRQKFNEQIKNNVVLLKKASADRQIFFEKFRFRVTPEKLKKEIDAIELKIETNVMSFDAEQKLMKAIKEKKKQYNEVKSKSESFTDYKKLSRDVKNLKRDADSLHKDIQQKAELSQKKHEEAIGRSKEVEKLKLLEKTFYEYFLKQKKAFVKINDKLKEELSITSGVGEKLNQLHAKEAHKKEIAVKKIEREAEKSVDEKLRKGGKITTDDLLAFQAQKK